MEPGLVHVEVQRVTSAHDRYSLTWCCCLVDADAEESHRDSMSRSRSPSCHEMGAQPRCLWISSSMQSRLSYTIPWQPALLSAANRSFAPLRWRSWTPPASASKKMPCITIRSICCAIFIYNFLFYIYIYIYIDLKEMCWWQQFRLSSNCICGGPTKQQGLETNYYSSWRMRPCRSGRRTDATCKRVES